MLTVDTIPLHFRKPNTVSVKLFGLFMTGVLAAPTAELLEFQSRCRLFLILVSDVIAIFAIRTLKNDIISRHN